MNSGRPKSGCHGTWPCRRLREVARLVAEFGCREVVLVNLLIPSSDGCLCAKTRPLYPKTGSPRAGFDRHGRIDSGLSTVALMQPTRFTTSGQAHNAWPYKYCPRRAPLAWQAVADPVWSKNWTGVRTCSWCDVASSRKRLSRDNGVAKRVALASSISRSQRRCQTGRIEPWACDYTAS